MTYALVNPFLWRRANGLTSYLRTMLTFLRETGIDRVMEHFRGVWRHAWNAVRQPAPVPSTEG